MSEQGEQIEEPSEEELRALLEEEMGRMRVEDMLLQSAVSLINLGGRRLGIMPGSEDERDLDQAGAAIDGVRGLMPVLERTTPEHAAPLREALSQLQMAFVQLGGTRPPGSGAPREASASEGAGAAGAPPEPGPAQRSSRLWVPGDS